MKKNILLLHGAIGSSAQWAPLLALPQQDFHFFTFDFNGHGGTTMLDQPFSMEGFVQEVLAFLDAQAIPTIDILGYSMGGYVAAMLAHSHPQRVRKVFTLATKWHWDVATAERETQLLQPQKIADKLPAFAEMLAQRHQPNDWKRVVEKTAEMLRAMGQDNPLKPEAIKTIKNPFRLALGDRDNMVSLDETVAAYRQFQQASLLVLPQTAHPIEKVRPERLLYECQQWFLA